MSFNLENLNLEDQVFGQYESDCCWCFSGVVLLEMYLQNLFPTFSTFAKEFFINNNYCDAQGNFALSRRYIAILSGRKNQGDSQLDFWNLVNEHGIVPRSMLDFTVVPTTDPNYQAFLNDFFNPAVITPAMTTLAEQFSEYVNVSGKNVPVFNNTTPVQIGIPIPTTISWNQPTVTWDNSPNPVAQHAVVKLPDNPDGSHPIIDSYVPWQKTLSANYPILIMTIPQVEVVDIANLTVTIPVIQQLIKLWQQLKAIGINLFN